MLPLIAGLLFGCARTAPVVAPPPPVESEGIVAGPLPGADSSVIQDVAESFDSTFVAAEAELQAQQDYLEGRALFERVDSMLASLVGPSALDDAATESNEVDTAAFAVANNEARQVLAQAARAQRAEDSSLAQSLLGDAQRLFERAVSLNPLHEEARYQLAQVYTFRANHFRQEGAWDQVLRLLRELVQLRADEHGLWAEMAIALDNLGEPEASAFAWRQAAEVVLDDSRLAFEMATPTLDSVAVFTYNVHAYRAFVEAKTGEGVRHSLAEAWRYATMQEEREYASRELAWALWDYENFENRLAFDSLRSVAAGDPLGARGGIATLMNRLARPSARREARYNHAVLSYDNGYEDGALDTLRSLWHDLTKALDPRSGDDRSESLYRSIAVDEQWIAAAIDSMVTDPLPYAEFMEDLRTAYATFLFERALVHRQEGASALAFTYLLQVTETGSQYTGRAYVEALKLARYNPRQALQLEPRVEAIFSTLDREDQLAYLVQMGDLYRRLGENDKVSAFLDRYKALRAAVPN